MVVVAVNGGHEQNDRHETRQMGADHEHSDYLILSGSPPVPTESPKLPHTLIMSTDCVLLTMTLAEI